MSFYTIATAKRRVLYLSFLPFYVNIFERAQIGN